MRQTSALYKTLLADPGHIKQSRLIIGGVVYDESQIVTLSTNEALFAEDTLSVGGAIAREIDFSAFLDDSVPRRAQIIHEVRLITSTQASEWLKKGVYYISTRSRDPLTGVTTVHGFDAMMAAEQEWKPAQTDIFPMSMKEAVEKTAAILHLALDPRNVYKTGEDYKVGYPVADGNASEEEQVKGLSIRQVWRWIAGAMGANFIINDLGELRLVPVNDATSTAYLADENGDAVTFGGDAILLRVASAASPELSALGNAAASVQQFPAFEAISRVILKIGGDQGYVSGSDTGRTIEIDCAYGSQTMANDLLAQLQGYVYQPMQADDALIDPAAELGDPVEVAGVYAVLAQKDTLWDMLSAADIAAPGGTGPEDEYGFSSAAASRTQYELAQARSLISKTNDRISMEIYGEDGKGGLNGKMATFTVSLSTISSKVESVETKAAEDLEAAKNDFNVTLKNYSTIEQTAQKIATEVKSVKEYTDGKVSNLDSAVSLKLVSYSTVEQTDQKIATRVAKGSIISEINQSAETVQISASKINLNGYVTFSSLSSAPGAGATKINGGWIDADTLTVKAANIEGTISIGKLPDNLATTDDIPDVPTSLSDLKGYESDVTTIVEGVIDTDYIYALGVTASMLRGSTVLLFDDDGVEIGGIDLAFYDQQETVDLHSNEVLWLTGNTQAAMMYGDWKEWVAVSESGVTSSSPVVDVSDRRMKKDITYGLGDMDGFFDDLLPADYRMVNGRSGRRHRGFVAQDVKANLEKHGISTQDFAGYVEGIKNNGEIIAGLRYNEFIPLLVDQVQRLKARVAELEGKRHGK